MPKGIRPTQDKVRKALFDILGDVEGLSFLELFAGSGAVGIEAVSRGVKELVLVESDSTCQQVLKRNIESLKSRIPELCTQKADKAILRFQKEKRRFDIIFLDPPYYKGMAKKTLQMLGAYDILSPKGFLVVQHFKKDDLPEALGDLRLLKRSSYGDTVLSFYRKGNPNLQIPNPKQIPISKSQ